jgi:hypothetical protein
MGALDDLIPHPHLLEVHRATIAAPPDLVWQRVRHGALAQSRPIRALFALRSLLMRDAAGTAASVCIDDLRSSPQRPGFQVLIDDPPRECAVATIGKVWQLAIPFVHVATAPDYDAFNEPGFVKVAWSVRVTPALGGEASTVTLEVRVQATDDRSWRKFRRYFRVIGPFSRYIRRSLLKTLSRDAARRNPNHRRPAPRVQPAHGSRGH